MVIILEIQPSWYKMIVILTVSKYRQFSDNHQAPQAQNIHNNAQTMKRKPIHNNNNERNTHKEREKGILIILLTDDNNFFVRTFNRRICVCVCVFHVDAVLCCCFFCSLCYCYSCCTIILDCNVFACLFPAFSTQRITRSVSSQIIDWKCKQKAKPNINIYNLSWIMAEKLIQIDFNECIMSGQRTFTVETIDARHGKWIFFRHFFPLSKIVLNSKNFVCYFEKSKSNFTVEANQSESISELKSSIFSAIQFFFFSYFFCSFSCSISIGKQFFTRKKY